MAAINFPSSPSNGDTFVVDGVTYTYNSAETKWKTTINSNAFLPLSGGTVSGNLSVSGDVTVDTNTLYVDSTNNRVGVGTTSPDNKLHIFAGDSSGSSHASAQLTIENSGNSALQFLAGTSSSSEIRFGDSGDNGAGSIAYVHSDNSLRFGTNNGVEKARIDSSGNLQFNSGYGSVATAYGCRAWVNFNGSSMAIRGSGNISSITDNGTGDYTLNFSTSFPDTNYAPTGSCRSPGTMVGIVPQFDVWNTGTLRFYTYNTAPTGYDQTQIAVAIYR